MLHMADVWMHTNSYVKTKDTLRATHSPTSTRFLFPDGDQLALAKLFPHSLCHLAVHEGKPWPRLG